MSLTVDAKIISQVYAKDDFRVFGCSPLKNYGTLELTNYWNFSSGK